MLFAPSNGWLWVGENLVTWKPDVFISRNQREQGGSQGGNHGLKTTLETVSLPLAWYHRLPWPEWHTCVVMPQHLENFHVSAWKETWKLNSMPSAERLLGEGVRGREQIVPLGSLGTVHPLGCTVTPRSKLTIATALPRPQMGRFSKHTMSFWNLQDGQS